MNVWFCAGSSTSSIARRGVAAEIGAHLVDLVEHHHGVSRARFAQLGDDAAGHRADVRAAMAADVGFVAHAAERDADELSAHRFGDDLPSDVLPTPGGPTKQRIAPPPVLFAAFELCATRARYSMIRRLPCPGRDDRDREPFARFVQIDLVVASRLAHGSSLRIWSYVRITPYSGDWRWGSLRARRARGRPPSSRFSGSFAASSFARS